MRNSNQDNNEKNQYEFLEINGHWFSLDRGHIIYTMHGFDHNIC